MIPINAPQISEREIEMVTKVLKSGILTARVGSSSMVASFEQAYAKLVGAKHAVAVNSGTAALHMALLAAGVKPRDEVIVPSFTFVATAEAVVLCGAKPVFVDIDLQTYNVDEEKLRKAVNAKTRAVIPVDLYGLSADMQAISKIAKEHDLAVIEDAAQAHGASYRGKHPGYFADMACWSFYASKNMTTGEGGMITTNNDEYADTLRCMRSHGEKGEYVSIMLGHNYRMPEIQAAIGIAQLEKLPAFLERRRRNAQHLTEELGLVKRLTLPMEPEGYKHSWYLYTVRLHGSRAERDQAVEELRRRGIGATVYYSTPVHLMPYYRHFATHGLPETEKASEQVFSLPVHPGVTRQETDFIADSVIEVVG
ncbi:MAG: DegT/DnrJ/EryC1/StrS family aminotransferase [Candidatus Bathyarchaeia archaeon]